MGNKILFLILFVASACSFEESENSPSVPYDLSEPETFILTDELHEVSGISLAADGQTLLAIYDEKGELYYLDLEGKIIGMKPFHKPGDYEDLAVVGKSVFVLKSNGSLYHIQDYAADSLVFKAYRPEDKFRDGLEFESLSADTLNSRLLMLVKDGEGREGKVPIYGFDLNKMEYFDDAVALLDPRTAPKVKVKGKDLKASAMAVHPVTGEWYVVSSISRMLLVSDVNGNGITSTKLQKKIFTQPEGICFLPDGTLLITTEGQNKSAKLFRFKYLERVN